MRFSRSTHLLMYLSLETLTSIIRTGLPILAKLRDLVNSVITSLSQTTLLRWLSFGSLTVTLTVLLFWISFFLLMLVFVLGNSDHVVVSLSIGFPSHSQWDAPFHHNAYDYSCIDWDDLRDHLRDVPWEDIFKGCVRYILQVCFLSLKESTCETRKNVFYFTSRALFVLEKIKF